MQYKDIGCFYNFDGDYIKAPVIRYQVLSNDPRQVMTDVKINISGG